MTSPLADARRWFGRRRARPVIADAATIDLTNDGALDLTVDPRSRGFCADRAVGLVTCNICQWSGERFDGVPHSESSVCPGCGSISRDRFLYFCMVNRRSHVPGGLVLETSPRLDERYREFMRSWARYYTCDYMLSAHKGSLCLDLQQLGLRDDVVDVVLTPHVLEHVPDTDAALAELFRVVRPGGSVFLQVPLLQGVTSVPPEPEFHGDNTPVFWRFGFDLSERLRSHGFEVALLVPADFRRRVSEQDWAWEHQAFDVGAMAMHADAEELTIVADDDQSVRHGFEPSYWFATWEAIKPLS